MIVEDVNLEPLISTNLIPLQEWYKLRDELIPLRAESLAGLLKNEKWNMDVETTQVLAETLEKRGMAIFKTIPQQAFQELDSRAAALIKEEIGWLLWSVEIAKVCAHPNP